MINNNNQAPKMIKLAALIFIFTISYCTKKNDAPSNQIAPTSVTNENRIVSIISSEDEFNKIMEKAGNKLIIFDLYADWCIPCKILSPTLEKIAESNKGAVSFYKINIDRLPHIAQTFGVHGIPHVAFMKNKAVVATLVGVQPEEAYLKAIAENSN